MFVIVKYLKNSNQLHLYINNNTKLLTAGLCRH